MNIQQILDVRGLEAGGPGSGRHPGMDAFKQYKYLGKTKGLGDLVYEHPDGHRLNIHDMPAMAGRQADIQWSVRDPDKVGQTQGFGYPALLNRLAETHKIKASAKLTERNIVQIPYPEFKKEHQHLPRVLRHGTQVEQEKEAADQAQELNTLSKRAKK